jgi:hypothetical protein
MLLPRPRLASPHSGLLRSNASAPATETPVNPARKTRNENYSGRAYPVPRSGPPFLLSFMKSSAPPVRPSTRPAANSSSRVLVTTSAAFASTPTLVLRNLLTPSVLSRIPSAATLSSPPASLHLTPPPAATSSLTSSPTSSSSPGRQPLYPFPCPSAPTTPSSAKPTISQTE